MTKMKKVVSYVLVFLMVFSSFTILPSEFWGWANVSAVDLTTEETQTVETNEEEIAVEANKTNITVGKSNAVETYTEGDFTYSIINDSEVEVVGYNGTSNDIVIPDVTTGSECPELANKKVTAIGDSAFRECNYARKLILQDGLKTIGKQAFYNSINLSEINIPDTVTTIGEYAFYGCYSLIDIKIGQGVKTINQYTFAFCIGLKKVTIGNNVETIDKFTFYYCDSLEELNIPDSVKTIKQGAVTNCKILKKVIIGSGCVTIDGAFTSNKMLESYTVSNDNPAYMSVDGVLFNKNQTKIVCYPKAKIGAYTIPNTVTEIGASLFAECKNLTAITIGKGVKTIGRTAFYNCTNLKSVTIGENVEKIMYGAFEWCTSLEKIDIPNNVQTIDGYCFAMGKLKYVTIGSGCASIANNALGDNLVSVTVAKENETYCSENGVLFNKNKTEIIVYPQYKEGAYVLPNTVTTINSNTFSSAKKLTELTIGDQITEIPNSAFSACSSLVKLNLGKGVKTIGEMLFGLNPAIRELDLSNCVNLVSIYPQAMYEVSSLRTLVLPDNLESIGDEAFCGCSKLKTIKFGTKLQSIGARAFKYCTSLESLTITDGDNTIIGGGAFNNCIRLKSITINSGVKKISASAFSQCDSLEKFIVNDDTLAEIGMMAFENCIALEEIDLGNGLENTQQYVFAGCRNLKKVSLGNKLTRIYFSLFRNCSSLQEITIPASVEYIDSNAFDGCTSLTTVKLLGKETTVKYGNCIPNNDLCVIYCYKNSTTHNSLKDKGFTNIKFFEDLISTQDIIVNGTSIAGFNRETKNYTVYLDNTTDVSIVPVFEEENVKYIITVENNVYTINVFDENDEVIDKYKVTVNEHNYTVTGDVTLMLNNISATKVGGSIVLQAGTYKLKIAKGEKLFGYNKVVADYCNGLTLNPKFTSYITLNATGGTYTIQFDIVTNKLVIKHDKNLPNEYLIGDIDTILKPVENRPLSIGVQQLPAGTYKFKLSIGGTEYGYSKVVDNATTGSLSVNSKYTSYITLNATGGIYTFTLNTETNKLIIRHTPYEFESNLDVHISGGFNLVLNDKSATGEDSNIVTGKKYLEDGCYTFKIYNYGVAYTAGAILNDSGIRTLSNKYTTPVTLNATGGTYEFTFDKETGLFEVILL